LRNLGPIRSWVWSNR